MAGIPSILAIIHSIPARIHVCFLLIIFKTQYRMATK